MHARFVVVECDAICISLFIEKKKTKKKYYVAHVTDDDGKIIIGPCVADVHDVAYQRLVQMRPEIRWGVKVQSAAGGQLSHLHDAV